jgi:hypothetical protein
MGARSWARLPPESRAAAACGAPRDGARGVRACGRVDLAAACVGRGPRIAPPLARACVAPLCAAASDVRKGRRFIYLCFQATRSRRQPAGCRNFRESGPPSAIAQRVPVIHLYFQATRPFRPTPTGHRKFRECGLPSGTCATSTCYSPVFSGDTDLFRRTPTASRKFEERAANPIVLDVESRNTRTGGVVLAAAGRGCT